MVAGSQSTKRGMAPDATTAAAVAKNVFAGTSTSRPATGWPTAVSARSEISMADVPDFARAPLSLSGIVLSAAPGTVSGPRDAFADILPVVPTDRAERELARGEGVVDHPQDLPAVVGGDEHLCGRDAKGGGHFLRFDSSEG